MRYLQYLGTVIALVGILFVAGEWIGVRESTEDELQRRLSMLERGQQLQDLQLGENAASLARIEATQAIVLHRLDIGPSK